MGFKSTRRMTDPARENAVCRPGEGRRRGREPSPRVTGLSCGAGGTAGSGEKEGGGEWGQVTDSRARTAHSTGLGSWQGRSELKNRGGRKAEKRRSSWVREGWLENLGFSTNCPGARGGEAHLRPLLVCTSGCVFYRPGESGSPNHSPGGCHGAWAVI